jgi:outer membrane protein
MAETEEILVQSRNRQRLAKAALAEILGLNPRCPSASSRPTPSAIDVPDDPFSALDYAIGPSARTGRCPGKLRRSKMAVDASRAGYLPQVDFMTRYYADDP